MKTKDGLVSLVQWGEEAVCGVKSGRPDGRVTGGLRMV